MLSQCVCSVSVSGTVCSCQCEWDHLLMSVWAGLGLYAHVSVSETVCSGSVSRIVYMLRQCEWDCLLRQCEWV